jgi:hypothetical protein
MHNNVSDLAHGGSWLCFLDCHTGNDRNDLREFAYAVCAELDVNGQLVR